MDDGYRLARPFHPGGFVRRKILEPRNLSIMGAACILGVPRQTLSDFLSEKQSLSAEMALKIEKTFGFSMDALMDMQTRFDVAAARERDRTVQIQLAAKSGSQPGKVRPAVGQRRSAA
ncbi:HigA family addiction module antitoxin [Methylobacterium sp. NEAU K]|uniref:HigA family addiction module antitoxin n=1 Tax=Methylobacterium sp. NEAU K TaxID=3064946 RepID=UPI002736DB76|nr:HigA family addiction module antitoxin [Methylobacterium sp. NEAU K]MDP4004036.1 HigA family addiction module antitoxin [Methylobacterium sp. NEAU K]